MDEETRDDKKVIQIGIGILVLLAVSVGLYYFLTQKTRVKPVEKDALQVSSPPPSEETAIPGSLEPLNLPPLELDKSDDLLRQLARDISSHPGLFAWMKTRDIVRKFVAAVDNIANGYSPKAQVDFFAPAREFKVAKRDGRLFIDAASFDRYNAVADTFISMDTRAGARLYLSLKPLFQQAYAELGYPDEDFQNTLIRASAELLNTPVVESRIYLEMKVSSYAMADPYLERLSEAQKQFLRMGPDNVQVIQTKLREIALAAGIPEYRLPKPRIYVPR